MNKTRLEELRNAYWRMDDALDGMTMAYPTLNTSDEMAALWKAHSLTADLLANVDPEWNVITRPETED